MTSVFGVTSMSFDKLLSLYLSEGTMIFTALLLVVAIIVFIKSKGRKARRTGCVVVGIYCILYLGAILALSFLFSSNHKPPEPSYMNVPSEITDLDSIHELHHVLTFAEQKGSDYAADVLLYLETYSYTNDDLHQKWGVPNENIADTNEDIWLLSDEYQIVIKYDEDDIVEKIVVKTQSIEGEDYP